MVSIVSNSETNFSPGAIPVEYPFSCSIDVFIFIFIANSDTLYFNAVSGFSTVIPIVTKPKSASSEIFCELYILKTRFGTCVELSDKYSVLPL